MKSKILTLFIVTICLQACGKRPSESNQSEALQQEMQSRKITRISPGQLVEKAMGMGDSISERAAAAWLEHLQPVMQLEDVGARVGACSIDSVVAITELEKETGTKIKKLSLTPIHTENKASGIEAELADAYLYNIENNIPLTGNVQSLNNNELLYSRAIIFTEPSCLKCHGSIEQSNSKVRESIVSTYQPSPAALDKQRGQLAGIWSITIPKQEIIKQLAK